MSNRVVCEHCGSWVSLPEGFDRARIRCTGCGYYADVPAELRCSTESSASTPVAKVNPRDADDEAADHDSAEVDSGHLTDSDNDTDTGPPLLAGTRDIDEDAYGDEIKPYAVPGTGTRPCPHCQSPLPLRAKLCVHCGRDLATGKKSKRRFQQLDRTWEEGWPFTTRLQAFLGLQLVNAVAAVLLIAAGGKPLRDCSSIFALVLTNLIQIALQAFLVGSFDTLKLKRTEKGKTILSRIRRLAFYKLPVEKLAWKASEQLGIAGTDIGCFARMLCLYFALEGILYFIAGLLLNPVLIGLAFVFCGMTIGFYWIVIRPERFEVHLCSVHGSTEDVIFRTNDRSQAEDVAAAVSDATGLRYQSVI